LVTSINSGFQKLKENLEITGLQKETVATRQQNVRSALEDELTVLDSFLAGSYCRSTMIAPLAEADVDIFNVLDSSYYRADGQASLLDKVRSVLLKTYPKTPKISRNGQAVTIIFTDFTVDVVPAFERTGGGYKIPDTIGKAWIDTNPNVHGDLLSKQNAKHDGDLVPLIKMVKGWNRTINYAFESFYLELITMQILTDVKISDFPSGVRYVFDKGREKIKYQVYDPAGYGGYINGLRNVGTLDEAVSRFETAYSRAKKAEEYASNDKIELAVGEWRKIFGDYFPAFG
jgi:hypothetical protein